MTISYVSENHTTQAYTGSPLVITKPTGTIDDDLLIAIVGGTRTGSTPSGWTQLSATTCGSSTGTVYVYYKIASSEGASYSFPTGSQLALGSVLCYRGADTSGPIDGTNFSFAIDTGTDFTTSSVTADGTQWSLSWAMSYKGSSGNSTITAGSGSQRGSTYGVTAGSENTSIGIFDSNGNVASGSTSRTQTVTSAAAGCRGIFLINDSGTSAPAALASASATANAATTLNTFMQSNPVDVAANQPTVTIGPIADIASASVAVQAAIRGITPGSPSAGAVANNAYIHADVNAHAAEVEASANDGVAYYGAPVVRAYFVPGENRTYIVRR